MSDPALTMLQRARTIAVVGLSPKPDRTSHQVAARMQRWGWQLIPVYLRGDEILGEPVLRDVDQMPEGVDLLNVFLGEDKIAPVVERALARGVKGIWVQLGLHCPEAAAMCRAAGVDYVENRCIKVDAGYFIREGLLHPPGGSIDKP